MNVTIEYIINVLVPAERAAKCVVGWVSNEPGAEAIRVHQWRYTTPTGCARECIRCGEFRHYGPRLDERIIRRSLIG